MSANHSGAAEKAAARIEERLQDYFAGKTAEVGAEAFAAIITEEMEREQVREEFFCVECGGKLTPNPMEGFDLSWMHFEGSKTCKLRGSHQQYLTRVARSRAEREKERKL